jgi:hypothetical protein
MKLRTKITSRLGLRTGGVGIVESDKEEGLPIPESVGSGICAGVSIHKDLCRAGQPLSA